MRPIHSLKSVPAGLVLSILLPVIAGAVSAETPVETMLITKEMEFPAHQVNLGDFQSPLVTLNGRIYLVWVDDQLRTRIAKKAPDGTITTNVIFDETDPDPYHNEASVGIDRDGYIHVVGNMHNSPYGRPHNDNPYYKHPWQYKVSNRPEDTRQRPAAPAPVSSTISAWRRPANCVIKLSRVEW